MRSNRPGIAGARSRQDAAQVKQRKGEEVEVHTTAAMMEQMGVFKSRLEEFAKQHRKEINNNPEFRHKFHQMCVSIGVDPLASKKGFWNELLGVNDFYYEVAVQAIEVCMRTKQANGGLMPLSELTHQVRLRRARNAANISEGDVEEAVKKVGVLGDGFKVVSLPSMQGGAKLVQSVPAELTDDSTTVLGVASANRMPPDQGLQGMLYCWLTTETLSKHTGWPSERCQRALNGVLQAGFAWAEVLARSDTLLVYAYWFPALCSAPQ